MTNVMPIAVLVLVAACGPKSHDNGGRRGDKDASTENKLEAPYTLRLARWVVDADGHTALASFHLKNGGTRPVFLMTADGHDVAHIHRDFEANSPAGWKWSPEVVTESDGSLLGVSQTGYFEPGLFEVASGESCDLEVHLDKARFADSPQLRLTLKATMDKTDTAVLHGFVVCSEAFTWKTK